MFEFLLKFLKIDGFKRLSQKIDGFDLTHRTYDDVAPGRNLMLKGAFSPLLPKLPMKVTRINLVINDNLTILPWSLRRHNKHKMQPS